MAQRVVGGGAKDLERIESALAFSPDNTGTPHPDIRKLDSDEVKSTVMSEVRDAIGSFSSSTDVQGARRDAMKLFLGKPLGNEVQGRSQVVMTEVADTIHWIMPSLMRMFTGGSVTAEFCPKAPSPTGDPEKDAEVRAQVEAVADSATAVINHVFRDQCDGFEELYDAFHTALLEKRSYLRVETVEKVKPEFRELMGLSPQELDAAISDGEWEVVEYDERMVEFEGQQLPVVDVVLKRVTVERMVQVRGLPPEEFLIARRERKLNDDTIFCGERRRVTSSDLIAAGYDVATVLNLPQSQSIETESNTVERRSDELDYPDEGGNRSDVASRLHWINDTFIRIDADGDGYSELRNVIVAGESATSTLLSNEYADRVPYASLTAFPMPYKHLGLSVADLVGDLQRIKSTLWRQMLDNIYLQNNQRHVILEGAVEVQDLLTSRPGGIIRANTLDAVKPLEVTPIHPITMGLIDKLDEVRETRTGVSAGHNGVDAAALKGGATGVAAQAAQAAARVELIGRIFAETGIKRLFELLYEEIRTAWTEPKSLRIGEQWIDVDPSQWPAQMDVKVKVGLGVGAAAERISYLMANLQLQQQAINMGAGFLATPRQVYETLSEITVTMGYEQEDKFFSKPPDDAQWPEPPPDAQLIESERKQKEDMMQHAVSSLKARTEQQQEENLDRFRFAELEQKARQAELDRENRLEVARLQAAARPVSGDSDD